MMLSGANPFDPSDPKNKEKLRREAEAENKQALEEQRRNEESRKRQRAQTLRLQLSKLEQDITRLQNQRKTLSHEAQVFIRKEQEEKKIIERDAQNEKKQRTAARTSETEKKTLTDELAKIKKETEVLSSRLRDIEHKRQAEKKTATAHAAGASRAGTKQKVVVQKYERAKEHVAEIEKKIEDLRRQRTVAETELKRAQQAERVAANEAQAAEAEEKTASGARSQYAQTEAHYAHELEKVKKEIENLHVQEKQIETKLSGLTQQAQRGEQEIQQERREAVSAQHAVRVAHFKTEERERQIQRVDTELTAKMNEKKKIETELAGMR